jgi:hypothetical protein
MAKASVRHENAVCVPPASGVPPLGTMPGEAVMARPPAPAPSDSTPETLCGCSAMAPFARASSTISQSPWRRNACGAA